METPQRTKPTRLYRSRDDRVIAGVAGGIARYLGIDPVLVRLAIVALAIVAGSGVIAYLIAWIVIPEERRSDEDGTTSRPPDPATSARTRRFVGAALVAVGVILLAQWAVPALNDVFWPLAVIVTGAAILFYGAKR